MTLEEAADVLNPSWIDLTRTEIGRYDAARFPDWRPVQFELRDGWEYIADDRPDGKTLQLDGDFTAEQLDALATWMRATQDEKAIVIAARAVVADVEG